MFRRQKEDRENVSSMLSEIGVLVTQDMVKVEVLKGYLCLSLH